MARVGVELHPSAIEEARAARQWYAERSLLASLAFAAELEHAVQQVGDSPSRWPQYIEGTRRFVLHRFPFIVVYRERADMVQVLAIAHGMRRPGYWHQRS